MGVSYSFPKIDTVLRNLKRYIEFFENKEKNAVGEDKEEYQEYIEFVDDYIKSVETYLDCVCNSAAKIERYKNENDDVESLTNYVKRLDDTRTTAHNGIIASMSIIDKVSIINGLPQTFDIDEKVLKDSGQYTPASIDEKKKMSIEQRKLRRYMGNFGLYIGASAATGFSIEDREAEKFATGEEVEPFVSEVIKKSSERKNVEKYMDMTL